MRQKFFSNFRYFMYLAGFFTAALVALASCSAPAPKPTPATTAEPVKFVFQEDPVDLPTWEVLAKDFGVEPAEANTLAKNFVGALSYGRTSQYYAELCQGHEDRCQSLDKFLEDMSAQQKQRWQARRDRRHNDRKLIVRVSAVKSTQALELRRLMGGLQVKKENEFQALAEKALETETCPRNLSATLSLRAAKFFPNPRNMELAQKLFDHAEPCLSNADSAWESIYLRHGLLSLMEENYERAERLLLQSMEGPTKVEQYRTLYWLGWMLHQKGTAPEANRYWQVLNTEYPLSYYSVKAITSWGKDPLDAVPERAPYHFARLSQMRPELNRRIQWLEILMRLNERSHAKRWLEWMSSDVKDTEPDVVHYVSAIALKNGYYRQNIVFLIKYFREHPDRVDRSGLRSLYPRPYFEDIYEEAKDKIHANLVMSLIRQESAFDPQAVSSARAKGLMQIIPRTARRLLRGGDRKLFDEKMNTQMGVKYLSKLGDRFAGEVDLALAAYNAGPNRVDEWLLHFPNRKNPLLWNDLIPYMETRDYVTSILRNNYWYERLYPMEKIREGVLASKMVEELKPANAN